MKKLLYLLIASIIAISCGNGAKRKTTATDETKQTDRVEVIYFHGAQRCITCRAIEANTKALLDSLYSKELASGKIVYKEIDISQKKNEAIADKYEVTWSSLFINKWKEGKENVNNMTEFAFANANGYPVKFKNGIKNKIDELLK